MPKRQTNGAAKTAQKPRRRSGIHIDPRRPLSAPQAAWDLWARAVAQTKDESWAEWARGVLTVAAAEELGIEPSEALSVLHGP